MAKLPEGSVDLILTDPPYGTTACKWDVVIPFEPMWEQIWRVLKPNGACVLFAGQPFTSILINSAIRDFKYSWIWEKTASTGFLNAKKMPLRLTEDITVFYKTSGTYNPQYIKGKPYKSKWSSGCQTNNDTQDWRARGYIEQGEYRYPADLLLCKKDKTKLHPTQKPVALLEYLIKTYTHENEVVLDFTMGSGSTGVACMNTGRKFMGIEKEEKYFEIAKQRIEEALCSNLDTSA